jgi:apolipoprotein N-acyltransferase
MRNRRYYLLSAIATGLLLAFSWPANGGLVPLIFLAWVPLLLAEERFATSEKRARPAHFMPYVLLAVAIWNAFTTWWLFCVSGPMGSRLFSVIGPNIGNDLLMCLPWLVMRWARWSMRGDRVRVVLVVAWIAFERFHMNWDLSWPWLTLGNVFAQHTEWVQWYEYTGHLGGSLWVWVVNLLCVGWIIGPVERRGRRAMLAALLIALPFTASLMRYFTFTEQGTPTEVVVVQPCIDPYNEKFDTDPLAQLDTMLVQAEALMTPATALVVMPETSLQEQPRLQEDHGRLIFTGLWENDLEGSASVQRIRAFLAKHAGTALVTGMSSAFLYPAGAELPVSAHVMENLGRGFDSYNAALLVRPDGSLEPYHKSKLVPGVELLPFEEVIGPLAGTVALDLGGTTGSLGVQAEREVLATPDGRVKVAPIICYESIYGDHVAAHVRNGATLLAIMTNDGWWDDSPAYKQHLAYGRLRAVETRRAIARSANTGISCFIDQRGDVHEATPWWVPDARRMTLLARSDLTFFARHGDLIGLGAEWFCLFIIVLMLVQRLRRRLTRA